MDFIAKKVFDNQLDGFKKSVGMGEDEEEDKDDDKKKEDKKKGKQQEKAEQAAAAEKLREKQERRRTEREDSRDRIRSKYNLAGAKKEEAAPQGGAPGGAAKPQSKDGDCCVM